jgi:hypothetical protein
MSRHLGRLRTFAAKHSQASGEVASACVDARAWLKRWLSGVDPFARLTWISSLSGPSRPQTSKPRVVMIQAF